MILVDAVCVHKWFDNVPHIYVYIYIGYPDKARVVAIMLQQYIKLHNLMPY